MNANMKCPKALIRNFPIASSINAWRFCYLVEYITTNLNELRSSGVEVRFHVPFTLIIITIIIITVILQVNFGTFLNNSNFIHIHVFKFFKKNIDFTDHLFSTINYEICY